MRLARTSHRAGHPNYLPSFGGPWPRAKLKLIGFKLNKGKVGSIPPFPSRIVLHELGPFPLEWEIITNNIVGIFGRQK